MRHRVAVLALDRVVPFDPGIPARVFNAARDAEGGPLYEVTTCSIGGGPVRTSADFSALAEGRYTTAPQPQVVGHGLEHIQKALDIQLKGVSAKKVVVSLPPRGSEA